MAWDEDALYERNQRRKGNVVDLSQQRQDLKWSHEVMIQKDREPRAAQESPLKMWWLKQQEGKDAKQDE